MNWNEAISTMQPNDAIEIAIETIYAAVAPLCKTPTRTAHCEIALREWVSWYGCYDGSETPASMAAAWDRLTPSSDSRTEAKPCKT